MNTKLASVTIAAILISSICLAETKERSSPIPLETEAQFKSHFGTKAVELQPGVYEVRSEKQAQRFFFGIEGLRAYVQERVAVLAQLESASWRTDDAMLRHTKAEIRAHVERLKETLESFEESLKLRNVSKCGTPTCSGWSSECFQGFNLTTSAENNSGSMMSDSLAFAGQFGPTTPMAVYAGAQLIDGYGAILPGSYDWEYDLTSYVFTDRVTASASGAGNGTFYGACMAQSGAEYIGYLNDYFVCDIRVAYSNSVFDCG